MGAKDTHQATVELMGIFLNTTPGPGHTGEFEWKPNVSFNYREVDDETFEPKGPEIKARINGEDNLWIFQAVGGKAAKGHFFVCMIESGPKPNAPSETWYKPVPMMEAFKDGTFHKIKVPVDGKVEVAVASKAPAGAKPSPAAPGAAAKTAAPTAAKPSAPGPVAPDHPEIPKTGNGIPAIAATYLDDALFKQQSGPWWDLKSAFDVDAMTVTNAFHFAAITMGDIGPLPSDVPDQQGNAKFREELMDWVHWYEYALREEKHERTRWRLSALLSIATTEGQVKEIANRAWSNLSKEHYATFREALLIRMDQVKRKEAVMEGTPVPEPVMPNEEQNPKEEGKDEDIPF